MNNRQNYEIINKHLQDILNAIIDIRKLYGGRITIKNIPFALFENNDDNVLNKLDEIKYKSQDALEYMFVLELKE